MPIKEDFGEMGRALGRFAQDVLYTELMPKGIKKYEPNYPTNSTAVMVGRNTARFACMYFLGHAALAQPSIREGLAYSIPASYLAADSISVFGLWGLNTYKNFYERLRIRHKTGKDDLENQPATLAIELPYRAGRGLFNAAKRIDSKKEKLTQR